MLRKKYKKIFRILNNLDLNLYYFRTLFDTKKRLKVVNSILLSFNQFYFIFLRKKVCKDPRSSSHPKKYRQMIRKFPAANMSEKPEYHVHISLKYSKTGSVP